MSVVYHLINCLNKKDKGPVGTFGGADCNSERERDANSKISVSVHLEVLQVSRMFVLCAPKSAAKSSPWERRTSLGKKTRDPLRDGYRSNRADYMPWAAAGLPMLSPTPSLGGLLISALVSRHLKGMHLNTPALVELHILLPLDQHLEAECETPPLSRNTLSR